MIKLINNYKLDKKIYIHYSDIDLLSIDIEEKDDEYIITIIKKIDKKEEEDE